MLALMVLSLVPLGIVSCKGTYRYETPAGSFEITIEDIDKPAVYNELEEFLGKCLALLTQATIDGDEALQEDVQRTIDEIAEAKALLSSDSAVHDVGAVVNPHAL